MMHKYTRPRDELHAQTEQRVSRAEAQCTVVGGIDRHPSQSSHAWGGQCTAILIDARDASLWCVTRAQGSARLDAVRL